MKIRESLKSAFDEQKDFFENVMEIATRSLLASYDSKQQFNQYVFESDSASQSNFDWWRTEIKKLLHYGMERQYIKNVDPEIMSYSIWCFCRGYNADAVGRKLPREEAVKSFEYSFSILLDGLRA